MYPDSALDLAAPTYLNRKWHARAEFGNACKRRTRRQTDEKRGPTAQTPEHQRPMHLSASQNRDSTRVHTRESQSTVPNLSYKPGLRAKSENLQ